MICNASFCYINMVKFQNAMSLAALNQFEMHHVQEHPKNHRRLLPFVLLQF